MQSRGLPEESSKSTPSAQMDTDKYEFDIPQDQHQFAKTGAYDVWPPNAIVPPFLFAVEVFVKTIFVELDVEASVPVIPVEMFQGAVLYVNLEPLSVFLIGCSMDLEQVKGKANLKVECSCGEEFPPLFMPSETSFMHVGLNLGASANKLTDIRNLIC